MLIDKFYLEITGGTEACWERLAKKNLLSALTAEMVRVLRQHWPRQKTLFCTLARAERPEDGLWQGGKILVSLKAPWMPDDEAQHALDLLDSGGFRSLAAVAAAAVAGKVAPDAGLAVAVEPLPDGRMAELRGVA